MDNTDQSLHLSASDKFSTQSFYVIIDRLITEMRKRRTAYATTYERFNFLLARSLSSDEIVSKSKALIEIYSSDLEEAFTDEFILFSRMFAESETVAEMIKTQIQDKLVTSFPNVNIAFRIYLSIFGQVLKVNVLFRNSSLSKLSEVNDWTRTTVFPCATLN